VDLAGVLAGYAAMDGRRATRDCKSTAQLLIHNQGL
jgi:hypothetical protein